MKVHLSASDIIYLKFWQKKKKQQNETVWRWGMERRANPEETAYISRQDSSGFSVNKNLH